MMRFEALNFIYEPLCLLFKNLSDLTEFALSDSIGNTFLGSWLNVISKFFDYSLLWFQIVILNSEGQVWLQLIVSGVQVVPTDQAIHHIFPSIHFFGFQ